MTRRELLTSAGAVAAATALPAVAQAQLKSTEAASRGGEFWPNGLRSSRER